MLSRHLVAAAVAGGAALALAASAAAAGQPYEVITPDGVTLRGWIHLPAAGGPAPTILEFTPYIDNNGSNAQNAVGSHQHLIDHGYALARVSVRGTGRSGGCLHFGDEVDADDVALVVEDLADQPWSTGKVGMVGHSYPAWTQDMAVSQAPPSLKAVVPTSGVIDLWSLLTRRGAPLAAGTGVVFAPAWTALTSLVNEGAPEHARCPNLPVDYASNAETQTTGDRTTWFTERDLREEMRDSKVPMLRSNGLVPIGEGHVMQVEGLWERLRPDRTRFILGQHGHAPPSAVLGSAKWSAMVRGWFDHYLRGADKTVATGVVDYQDDSGAWNQADRWPPRAERAAIHLSGTKVVQDGDAVAPATQTLQSSDLDAGPNVEVASPRYSVAACGPHQALWISEPAQEDVLLAGNVGVELSLSSTLPGGHLGVMLWKTSGPGTCPDTAATMAVRAVMDLRHWLVEGRSRDFPIATPTKVTLDSEPFASKLRKGERLVVGVSGGSSELTPDPLKPLLTVHSGSLDLPVVEGELQLGMEDHDAARLQARRRPPSRPAG